ncbi:MAG: SLC26A/SulP transporter family protein [Leptospiraceae bacterium]|nr:SLC26A/SulP transporter family protein [Leptospiraceae bacterium]
MKNLANDFMGGLASMLVALPSAIAFGLIVYSPLGREYFAMATIAGILGTVILGLLASIFGGTIGMISAPCAPAAAVLSTFVIEMNSKKIIPTSDIPAYLIIIVFFAGLFQFLAGRLGGGKIIKFIPYPVIAGYLSGVGILIFVGQVPKFFGIPQGTDTITGLLNPSVWNFTSISIGCITILTMIISSKYTPKIPSAIIAFSIGITSFFIIGYFHPTIMVVDNNPLIIGKISASANDVVKLVEFNWSKFTNLNPKSLEYLIVPSFTLGILLSIDTLKTSVLLDVLLGDRHNSNKELMAQGIGNIATSLCCGIPGGGTTGPTLVNVNSGGRKYSGIFMGLFSLLVLLILGSLLSWIPIAALSGVLVVIAYKMIDFKSIKLLRNPKTRYDFFVILSVVVSASYFGLVSAAALGIIFAISLFLREQIHNSVIFRKYSGTQFYSKKRRLNSELEVLAKKDKDVAIFELQGQLFFGTADQLFMVLEPFIGKTKYIILSLKRIKSMDFTAVNLLKQIQKQIQDKNGTLIIASIPPGLLNYLKSLGMDAYKNSDNLRFFIELDKAKEWVEEIFLEEYYKDKKKEENPLKLKEFEFFEDFESDIVKKFREAIKSVTYSTGSKICEMGQSDDEIYFIRKGEIKIYLPLPSGQYLHLATFCRGDFFGEMSFLDNEKRSAHAIAEEDTVVYVMSRKQFDKVTKKYPEVSSKFFERLAYAISYRLRLNHSELIARED